MQRITLHLTISILFFTTLMVKAQNSESISGFWNIQKNPNDTTDLFDSKYSFVFNEDKTFQIVKPVEASDDSTRIDETGRYRLFKDSIEIIVLQEDGIPLKKPQSVTCKIIKLTKTELVIQWPKLIRIGGENRFPELKFIKE